MNLVVFLTQYALWHYGRGIRQFLSQWWTFIWFTGNFFSMPLLLRTLLSPLERLSEEYKAGLDLGSLAQTLLVNTIMRFIGAIVRLFIIGMGLVSLVIIIVSGLALFVIWLLLPFVVLSLVILGGRGLTEWLT